MNKEKRIKEIESSFTSFTKETYHKSEVLDELLKLQRECARIAYPEKTEEELASIKFKGVIWKLGTQCSELGNVALNDLNRFKHASWRANDKIRSEIAGINGEKKVNFRLIEAGCKGTIIRNLEISNEFARGELDFVVLDPRAAFIIESKHIGQDIFIDECGGFYSDGERTRKFDNLHLKMARKERLLRDLLDSVGHTDLPIKSVVVFTNERYGIVNHCKELSTCTLGKLPYFISEHVGQVFLNGDSEKKLGELLLDHAAHETYAPPISPDAIKNSFACTLAAIEEAREKQENLKKFGSVTHWFFNKLTRQSHAVA